jgi:3-polyprenyl-4-hydroxybenzoate decarboxylase
MNTGICDLRSFLDVLKEHNLLAEVSREVDWPVTRRGPS